MSDLNNNLDAIVVSQVWKRFHRGEHHDSLRDLIPAMAKRFVGRGRKRSELGESDFWALKDVSFQVNRGEAFGIIGPNGAGKSTMLKLLTRILRCNRGTLRVNGKLTALLEVAAGFHHDLTGRENIFLNGAILGMRKSDLRRKLDAIIAFSGIESFIDTPVKRYSTGMRARLGFAVAAHMEPEILLIDEVLSVGDASFRAKCLERMQQLVHSDVSVLFVSHNLDQVRQLCDRCLVLDRGAVRFIGSSQEACDYYLRCLQNCDSVPREGWSEGNCRLLKVTLRNEHGQPTIFLDQFRPISIDIEYELAVSSTDIDLEINFRQSDGGAVTSCHNTVDKITLPASKGRHSVRLEIDGLPFNEGDYMLAATLNDKQSDYWDKSSQWVTVRGINENHQLVTLLRHRWREDSPSEQLEPATGHDRVTLDNSANMRVTRLPSIESNDVSRGSTSGSARCQ
jgi:lipopolysaccharide transport system ATP-binding protein